MGRDYRVWAIDLFGQGMSLPSEDPAPLSKEGCPSDRKYLPWGFGDETELGQVIDGVKMPVKKSFYPF